MYPNNGPVNKVMALILILLLSFTASGCGGGGGGNSPQAQNIWSLKKNGQILEIGYGIGSDSPQIAALHLDSSYFRLCPPGSGWGTSVVVMPAFWERTTSPTVVWEKVASLPASKEIAVLPTTGTIIVRTPDSLYRSTNGGATFDNITPSLGQGSLYAITVDSDNLYLATRNGVLKSQDAGSTFSWEYSWSWDASTSVDFKGGYGTSYVTSWGNGSGPLFKSPQGSWNLMRGDIPFSAIGQFKMIRLDQQSPLVAYIGGFTEESYLTNEPSYGSGYRTSDGGVHWSSINDSVFYATNLNGTSTAFTGSTYSPDQGATWQPLGIRANALVKDEVSGKLFAAKSGGGVSMSTSPGPGQWVSIGLPDQKIRSLAMVGKSLLAMSVTGDIFKANIDGVTPTELLRQGAPVEVSWKTDNNDLLITYTGKISSLDVSGTIRIIPPGTDSITATITTQTAGSVYLASRPNEAFKPVMLSSMHINSDIWDARSAYILEDTTLHSYQFPASGWVVSPAVSGNTFGLFGGSSSWKPNAPTLEVTMDQALPITGWVTSSQDPNDDNIGFWAGSNSQLTNWSYTITSK